jgi:hypothetical protein
MSRVCGQIASSPDLTDGMMVIKKESPFAPTHIIAVVPSPDETPGSANHKYHALIPVHDIVLYLQCSEIRGLEPSPWNDHLPILKVSVPSPSTLGILLYYLTLRRPGCLIDLCLTKQQVFEIYENACALGVQDNELYRLLDGLWKRGGTQLFEYTSFVNHMNQHMRARWNNMRRYEGFNDDNYHHNRSLPDIEPDLGYVPGDLGDLVRSIHIPFRLLSPEDNTRDIGGPNAHA